MKNKKTLALIIGVACLLILLVVLIISLNRHDDTSNPPQPQNDPNSQTTVTQPDPEIAVPELKGLSEDEAKALLEKAQLKAGTVKKEYSDTVEEGKILDQNPAKDQKVKPGAAVDYTVSMGKEPEKEPEKQPDNNPDQSSSNQNQSGSNEKPAEEPDPVVPTSGLNPNPTTKEEIERVLNDPFMILVNRERRVSSDYVGSDLVTFNGSDYELNSTAAGALRKLVNAGKSAGYYYVLYSGYRSYSSQYNKYYNKISYYEGQGKSHEEAVRLTDEYYAPPGGSEHHTGLAADVCIPSIVNQYNCLHENYDQTAEFRWFSTHAHEYGFIMRYPQGKESITGYNYEPWHYRYVGVEIATEIYRRGITLEEYVEELESKLNP